MILNTSYDTFGEGWSHHVLIPCQKFAEGKSPRAAAMFLDVPTCKKKSRWSDRQRWVYVACEYSVSQFANRYTFGELDVIW